MYPPLYTGLLVIVLAHASRIPDDCPYYGKYAQQRHGPFSAGKHNLSYMRPEPRCRTLVVPEVEAKIDEMRGKIADPDLFRMFENTWPNTVDTTVTWMGTVNSTESDANEVELAFVSTGDINAMWLRDSANQLHAYASLLSQNTFRMSVLAKLFRGVINLQSRYIAQQPFCQAFQPPPESGIEFEPGYGADDVVFPPFSRDLVWECKWELDSLASFIMVNYDYWVVDRTLFNKSRSSEDPGKLTGAFDNLFETLSSMKTGTYAATGEVLASPYRFKGKNGSGGLRNDGAGSPVQSGTGLIRSAFRPSDDDCTYQLHVPSNAMIQSSLHRMEAMKLDRLLDETNGPNPLDQFGDVVTIDDPTYGRTYAYEVDGYGGANVMDDANIPSLLSLPMYTGTNLSDPVYQATRNRVLSRGNPYFSNGSIISGVGSPHTGTGKVWPMAKIAQVMTSDDEAEIVQSLRELLRSTDGYGLMHESVSAWNASDWTRQWFAWANGLFGQMILDLDERKPHILQMSFQDD